MNARVSVLTQVFTQVFIEVISTLVVATSKVAVVVEFNNSFYRKEGVVKRFFAGAVALILSIPLTVYSSEENFHRYGQTVDEQEALQWIWKKAQRISGIQSIFNTDNPQHLPVYIITEKEMHEEICPDDPQNCRNLGGAYDTEEKRILLRNDLVPEEDIISASFLLHELIHALRNETMSAESMFGTCSRLRLREQEAYDAQNVFLKSEGALFRAGIAMRMMACPEDKSGLQPVP